MQSTVELLSNLEASAQWISENYQNLKKRFNNKWVAVLDKVVVDSDKAFDVLVKRLRSRFADRYNEIAFEYVTDEELNLIL